jgi:arylsulfatase A-like enzyme
LSCYGGIGSTSNFDRLAVPAVTFDRHYIGSMPCMPARCDMHSGRLNFLHRSWGPLEPFDNSFPEILKAHWVYSHLVSEICCLMREHDAPPELYDRFDLPFEPRTF